MSLALATMASTASVSASAASSGTASAASAAGPTGAPEPHASARFHALLKASPEESTNARTHGHGLQGILYDAADALQNAQAAFESALNAPSALHGAALDPMTLLRLQSQLANASSNVKVIGAVTINVCKDFAELVRGGGS